MSEEIRQPIGSDEYNDEPVYYCSHCLSLAIKEIGFGLYCLDCGSTSIKSCNIDEYDEMYKAKYGSKLFNK